MTFDLSPLISTQLTSRSGGVEEKEDEANLNSSTMSNPKVSRGRVNVKWSSASSIPCTPSSSSFFNFLFVWLLIYMPIFMLY